MDTLRWLPTGAIGIAALVDAVRAARRSVRLEMFIFRDGPPGRELGAALTAAAERGVRVSIHLDALGSRGLADDFWTGLRAAGGEVRRYHPFGSGRFLTRSHRKLCVVDDEVAYVAGFNIAPEYNGDGIREGWLDVGLEVTGAAAGALGLVFDEQFQNDDRRPGVLARYQKRRESRSPDCGADFRILPVSPGRGDSCLLRSLYADLPDARRIWLCSPYFLPPPKLRRMLGWAARRGADVRLILPAKTDVSLSRFAARRLYAGLLRQGVQIHEYQPQILHAKLFLIDGTMYVGSSNLDPRSLYLNHEIMVRSPDKELAAAVERTLGEMFAHSRRVEPKGWARSRSWTEKLRERWSFFVLYRLDPWLTRRFTAAY